MGRSWWRGARSSAVVGTALLLVGACTGGGDRPDPDPSAARYSMDEVWRADIERRPAGGAWNVDVLSTADTVVGVTRAGVHGYRAKSGARLWKVKPPRGATVPCGVTGEVNSAGIGVVLYGKGAEYPRPACTTMAAIDTRDGSVLWSRSLDRVDGLHSEAVSVSERVVAVSNGHGGAASSFQRHDVITGERLGALKEPSGKCALMRHFVGDGRVVRFHNCGGDHRVNAYDIDSADGAAEWSRPVNHDIWNYDLVGAEGADGKSPLVFSGRGRVFRTYDATGRRLPDITVSEKAGDEVGARDPLIVSDAVLVTRHSRKKGTDTLVAHDLSTGKQLWEIKDKRGYDVLGVDRGSGSLLALANDSPGIKIERTLRRIGLRTGKVTKEGELPYDKAVQWSYTWDRERLYGITFRRKDSSAEKWQLAIAAYRRPV
ncbi:outer membrane protein assembly factor BamB family protein [Streptomyces triticagri]|nr:PQQ-binding-like beta-propeller repeat protein [Streptomyces triticagri]